MIEITRPRRELVEIIVSAFDQRQLPTDAFDLESYEGSELAVMLGGVDRRRITTDFAEAMAIPPGNWLAFMTNEGRIYYFPALMMLCFSEGEYGCLEESILGCLSPWPFGKAPHTWKEVVERGSRSTPDVTDASVSVAVNALVDPDAYFKSEKALIQSLNARERRAVRLFVEFLPTLAPHTDPLLIYSIVETLDGRIEPGDGYSWLPKHEMNAVIDFIDFLVDECGSMLSEPEAGGLLVRRSSFDSG